MAHGPSPGAPLQILADQMASKQIMKNKPPHVQAGESEHVPAAAAPQREGHVLRPNRPTGGGGFGQFRMAKFKEYQATSGGNAQAILKVMGAAWKNMSEVQKQLWNKKYMEVFTEYQEALQAFKASDAPEVAHKSLSKMAAEKRQLKKQRKEQLISEGIYSKGFGEFFQFFCAQHSDTSMKVASKSAMVTRGKAAMKMWRKLPHESRHCYRKLVEHAEGVVYFDELVRSCCKAGWRDAAYGEPPPKRPRDEEPEMPVAGGFGCFRKSKKLDLKTASREWKVLTDEERLPYNEMYKRAKAVYCTKSTSGVSTRATPSSIHKTIAMSAQGPSTLSQISLRAFPETSAPMRVMMRMETMERD